MSRAARTDHSLQLPHPTPGNALFKMFWKDTTCGGDEPIYRQQTRSDEPLAGLDIWGGFAQIDEYGQIPTVEALEEHFRQLKTKRLHDLMVAERTLASRPPPPLEAGLDLSQFHDLAHFRFMRDNGKTDRCCCCWGRPTAEQVARTHTENVGFGTTRTRETNANPG